MRDLVDSYVDEQLRLHNFVPGTAANVRSALNGLLQVIGDRSPDELDQADVRAYLASISHLRPGTRYSRFSAVRSWCRWLIERGALAIDPTHGIKPPKVPRRQPRALETDKIRQLLAAAPDARGRAIIALCYEEGLRVSEVARLELADWDRSRRLLHVLGKGGKSRIVHVSELCEQVLDEYLAEHPGGWGPLIRSYTDPGVGLSGDRISRLVSRWMRDAGLKRQAYDGVSAHALRHTSASDLLDASGDIVAVQEFLGHARLDTTQDYLRRAGIDRIRAAMEARTAALSAVA